ncbi:hypothetical protein ATCC53582_02686 [Novacetimonas hansenii]|nr:hypothetical protein ATCC53582_02686 [Novacetimonas hansenii]
MNRKTCLPRLTIFSPEKITPSHIIQTISPLLRNSTFLAVTISLFAISTGAQASGLISSLASTAAHSAAASAAGTGAAMATAHEMNKHQEDADSVDSSPASVCGKLLVTHSVAKQISPLVGQAASHIVVQVSNETADPDGIRHCIGTVTFPGGKRNVSWTAQKHGLLYKVAATLAANTTFEMPSVHKVTI